MAPRRNGSPPTEHSTERPSWAVRPGGRLVPPLSGRSTLPNTLSAGSSPSPSSWGPPLAMREWAMRGGDIHGGPHQAITAAGRRPGDQPAEMAIAWPFAHPRTSSPTGASCGSARSGPLPFRRRQAPLPCRSKKATQRQSPVVCFGHVPALNRVAWRPFAAVDHQHHTTVLDRVGKKSQISMSAGDRLRGPLVGCRAASRRPETNARAERGGAHDCP